MLKLTAIITVIIFIQACGTTAYIPTEYPLRDGLIPNIKVSGEVSVKNVQPSKEPTIVYSYMGTKLSSDLNSITETMVQQTIKELSKNSTSSNTASSKSIDIKVTSLLSTYVAMFWKSKIKFVANLGNGEVIEMEVTHRSGILMQNLNGCIAEAVLFLLKDHRVIEYLES